MQSKKKKKQQQIEKWDIYNLTKQWLTSLHSQSGPPEPNHECSHSACRDFIEPINYKYLLFGCPISGRIHQCFSNEECLWRYVHEGTVFCVFSHISLEQHVSAIDETSSAYQVAQDLTNQDIPSLPPVDKKRNPEDRWKWATPKGEEGEEEEEAKETKPDTKRRCRKKRRKGRPKVHSDAWFNVVSTMYHIDASLPEFCSNLEEEACTVCKTLLCTNPVRAMYEQKWTEQRTTKARALILDYVENMQTFKVAPNMHIMDNLYESYVKEHHRKQELQDVSMKRHLRTLSQGIVCLWFCFMVAIGGHPFKENRKGIDLCKALFRTESEKAVMKKAKAVPVLIQDRGPKTHLFSYHSCFRKFVMACLVQLCEPDGIRLTHSGGIPCEWSLFPFEPEVAKSFPDDNELMRNCIEMLMRRRSSGSHKRAHPVQMSIKITRNGSIFSNNSIKEATLLYKKCIHAIDLAQLHHLISGSVDIMRCNVGIRKTSSFSSPEEEEEKKVKLIEMKNGRLRSPYEWIVDTYSKMDAA